MTLVTATTRTHSLVRRSWPGRLLRVPSPPEPFPRATKLLGCARAARSEVRAAATGTALRGLRRTDHGFARCRELARPPRPPDGAGVAMLRSLPVLASTSFPILFGASCCSPGVRRLRRSMVASHNRWYGMLLPRKASAGRHPRSARSRRPCSGRRTFGIWLGWDLAALFVWNSWIRFPWRQFVLAGYVALCWFAAVSLAHQSPSGGWCAHGRVLLVGSTVRNLRRGQAPGRPAPGRQHGARRSAQFLFNEISSR